MSELDESPEVVGVPPDLGGLACSDFILGEFWYEGKLAESANNVYLRFRDQWHQLAIDTDTIFWSLMEFPPEPEVSQDSGWPYECKLVDLASDAQIRGVCLERYEMLRIPGGAVVKFKFANGVRISISSVDDQSSYSVSQEYDQQ